MGRLTKLADGDFPFDSNDTVEAGVGAATVRLGNGNDAVILAGAVNMVVAGDGDDTVTGGQGGDTITLGSGQDSVREQGYGNVLTLGDGNDTVEAGAGTATVRLGNGNGNSRITLDGWDNNVTLGNGFNTVNGGSGNDVIQLSGGNADLWLTGRGDMVFLGGSSANVVDKSSYLTLNISPGGVDVIHEFGADRSNIVNLLKGTGDYTSSASILSNLNDDGHGGAKLLLGSGSSIDFMGTSPQAFSIQNFKIS